MKRILLLAVSVLKWLVWILVLTFCMGMITACSRVTARLSNGETITCSIYENKACGVSFYRCDDHDHECETNFEWIKH